VTGLDPDRRSRLLGLKLATLAREHLDLDGEPLTYPGGAALVSPPRGAVLADVDPLRALGPALAWSRRNGVDELHLLAEDAAGLLARRAAEFEAPPAIWWVQGRDLHAVEPEPSAPAAPPSEAVLAFEPQLRAAGCDVRVEHGSLVGEILGLEVARVVEPFDGPPRLEVGVGRHDREAFAIIHGDLPTDAALTEVVASVRRYRRADVPAHPLHRLAAERWLREVVVTDPALVGAARLDAAEGPVARPNVKEAWPAVATGDGVVVVCSIGIDLDLVPFAADARLAHGNPDARLVLVLPARDDHRVTREVNGLLRNPAEIVAVPDDWRSLPAGQNRR
jgi:hypothetical protein